MNPLGVTDTAADGHWERNIGGACRRAFPVQHSRGVVGCLPHGTSQLAAITQHGQPGTVALVRDRGLAVAAVAVKWMLTHFQPL